MLTAIGLLGAGVGSILLALLTWHAWKNDKPRPLDIFGLKDEPRTEMKTIALGFEIFFEILTGILLIAWGIAVLP